MDEELMKNADEANLLWDEYKYRHDLIWRHLIRSTLALVALVTVRYANAFHATPALIIGAGIAALAYWLFTVFVVEAELRHFTRIKTLHQSRQALRFKLPEDTEARKDQSARWRGQSFFEDNFTFKVGAYLVLLLVATALTVWASC